MTPGLLILPVLIPAIAGALCLACRGRLRRIGGPLLVAALAVNLGVVAAVCTRRGMVLELPLGGFDLALRLRVDALASFVLLSAAVLGLLIGLYSARFMARRRHESTFLGSFLFTMALANGALLADHLVTLLFFWEGLLVPLYVMIAVGHRGAWSTAAKAFAINGATDLCMLAGLGLVYQQAHTPVISQVHLDASGISGLAFVLLAIGATSKAGAMPFHSWIPDAAVDAPAPFMALVPGVIEKLLGIYALARVSLDMFDVRGWAGTLLMIAGAATILLAVLMALVQRDYKRLLAFHAISQVGYMILGIGTGTAAGIVGGLFHMVNHAMYKGTLFLTAGAVERQAGTTDLAKLGGLAARMPVTFVCFVVAACSICGVPPFNGFYSKELVYEGALSRGAVYYAVAVLGSFFTAASFLKLGHAAWRGRYRAPSAHVDEAPWTMLAPMAAIASLCVLFGIANRLPIALLVAPSVAAHFEAAQRLGGIVPSSGLLAGVSLLALAAAIGNHAFGVRRSGSPLGAADHIHDAPVARTLFDWAARGLLDPYRRAVRAVDLFARAAMAVDRAIDFAIDRAAGGITLGFSFVVRRAHNGDHARYLAWSLVGTAAIVFYLLGGF